jgi:hypothetical protein
MGALSLTIEYLSLKFEAVKLIENTSRTPEMRFVGLSIPPCAHSFLQEVWRAGWILFKGAVLARTMRRA